MARRPRTEAIRTGCPQRNRPAASSQKPTRTSSPPTPPPTVLDVHGSSSSSHPHPARTFSGGEGSTALRPDQRGSPTTVTLDFALASEMDPTVCASERTATAFFADIR